MLHVPAGSPSPTILSDIRSLVEAQRTHMSIAAYNAMPDHVNICMCAFHGSPQIAWRCQGRHWSVTACKVCLTTAGLQKKGCTTNNAQASLSRTSPWVHSLLLLVGGRRQHMAELGFKHLASAEQGCKEQGRAGQGSAGQGKAGQGKAGVAVSQEAK